MNEIKKIEETFNIKLPQDYIKYMEIRRYNNQK